MDHMDLKTLALIILLVVVGFSCGSLLMDSALNESCVVTTQGQENYADCI